METSAVKKNKKGITAQTRLILAGLGVSTAFILLAAGFAKILRKFYPKPLQLKELKSQKKFLNSQNTMPSELIPYQCLTVMMI